MLAALRERSAGIIAKALFVLLILSFGVWGIGDMVGGRSDGGTVAEIGETEVTSLAFIDAFDREVSRLQTTLSPTIDRNRARAFGLDTEVLQRMITQALLAEGAQGLGIVAPDEEIAKTVRTTKAFMVGDVFDRQRFAEVLYASNLAQNQYFDLVRSDLVRAQYINPLTAATTPPAALTQALYAFNNENRTVETLFVAAAAMTAALPTEEQVVQYHKDNAARFTAPEYRALSVLHLTAADVAKEIMVSDADIRAAYDERLGDFSTLETRRLRQMVIADEKAAQDAAKRLAQGADFAATAKDVAGMDAAALDLGDVDRDQLLPEMAEPAFQAAKGTVVGPIKSPLGWHLIAVDAITPASTKPLATVRAKLKTTIAQDRALDALFKTVNQVEDSLGGGATLEETARSVNIKLLKVTAIDRSGKAPSGNKVAEIPAVPAFLSSAFTTPEGEDSLLVEAGDEGYFVLHVGGVTAPALKPLETVRADVTNDLMNDARDAAAKAVAEGALTMAQAGQSFAAIAKATGASVKALPPFTRSGHADLPGDLVDTLFAAKQGDAAMGATKGGYRIARLSAVTPAKADAAATQKLIDELSDAIRNDLLAQLTQGLRARHPVSVNAGALNALFAPSN